MNELKVVWRRLRNNPGFAMVCVLTLALGIGVNVAIFSLVYGVLLKPLPYPDAERIVVISHDAPGLHLDGMNISAPLYLRYKEQAMSFEDMALLQDGRVSLTGIDVPAWLRQGTVTASFFGVFGVPPLLGRPFMLEDEKPGAPPVAIISERLWRGRWGSDPDILGRGIEIDGTRRDVVGVMPAHFEVPDAETDVWLPLVIDPVEDHLGKFGPSCFARLKTGVSRAAALADLKRFTDNMKEHFPEERAALVLARSGFMPVIVPLLDQMVGNVERALWVVLGAVGFVLLMACANVANLFLVRAESRQRELALCRALGATRARLVGSFLVEGLILATAAGALGVLLAQWAIGALVGLAPEGIPRLHHAGVDGPVIVFTIAVSLLSALLFSALPALPYGGGNVALALREAGRGTSAGHGRLRARRALVIVQIALALVLLIGAGLMVRSFHGLMRVEPGFDPTQTLTLRLSLPGARYGSPERVAALVDRLTERIGALPGVRAVGALDNLPLSGSARGAGHALQDFPRGEDDLPPVFMTYFVGPGYLAALGIPLIEGRWFEPADHQRKTGAAVVSQSIARRYWPEASAIGRRIRPGRADDTKWYTIVGVVGDVRQTTLLEEPGEIVYYPLVGHQGDPGIGENLSLVLRTRSTPETLAPAVRSAVAELEPDAPITHVLTLDQVVAQARAPVAFNMLLLLVASSLAVVLGAIGIYGVTSFVAAQRTQEFGVRMALGAVRGQVRALVLRDGVRVALPGLGIGLAAAVAVTQLMKSLLFGVNPLDPLTFAIVALFLLGVTLISSFLPAERATRIDPAIALRHE